MRKTTMGHKVRSFALFVLLAIICFKGKYIICGLCSVAAQVGLWIEPLGLDTENMHLPTTALFLWLPIFLILTLVFTIQAKKRKSWRKTYYALLCLVLGVWSTFIGMKSLWYYGEKYSEGYWIFSKSNHTLFEEERYGARNFFGVIVIPAEYESMRHFENGYSIVEKGGLWGAIDKDQKVIIPFEHSNPNWVENTLYGIPFYD